MPNSSLATVEEDGGVILSTVQVLSPVGTREVTVVPAALNQTKPRTVWKYLKFFLFSLQRKGGEGVETCWKH